MNATSTRNVIVETGGTGVVAHVGLHVLGRFSDRLGLGSVLSDAVGWNGPGIPTHDRGRVLTQMMLVLTGGGEACTDIEMLASGERLFGSVCSDTTMFRTFTQTLDPDALDRSVAAFAGVRNRVWSRLPSITATDDPLILDVDASLVDVHSENKEGTAANFKRGFGFHPIFCFADATGEALGLLLRPGNATANDTADLLAVIDQAVCQVPPDVARGHRVGDHPDLVSKAIVVRSDSAGSQGFAQGCRERNLRFQTVARRNVAVSAAIDIANEDPDRWEPAVNQDGTPQLDSNGDPVSEVCEVTDLVDLSAWPAGTRLIIRREPLHPGAQQTLLPHLSFRFWGHYTDTNLDPVEADRSMRAHAHVEDHIRRLKDSGLERFPFTSFEANQAWMQTICWAADLTRWFQMLCLDGSLAKALPKRLRWQLWHTPARIIRSGRRDIIRIIDQWPTAGAILAAHQRIAGFT